MINKEICPPDRCTGCGACMNGCPVDAITMLRLPSGFDIPDIDPQKCIECGKCKDVCPILSFPDISISKPDLYYQGAHPDKQTRHISTSGGIFAMLAERILKQHGYVFGAAFDELLQTVHIEIKSLEDLPRMQGSKYVQSSIQFCFRQVKQRLKENQYVLFSGTPCQVLGLRAYLGKTYEKLLTCDFICHGVPAPGLFASYLTFLKKKCGFTPSQFYFRDKQNGWHDSGRVMQNTNHCKRLGGVLDAYCYFFYKNLSLRHSCFQCPARGKNSLADITLGDSWGEKKESWEVLSEGLSLAIGNTEFGKNILSEIADSHWKTLEYQTLYHNNFHIVNDCKIPEMWESFQQDVESMNFNDLVQKYYRPSLSTRLSFFVKNHLPRTILLMLRYINSHR